MFPNHEYRNEYDSNHEGDGFAGQELFAMRVAQLEPLHEYEGETWLMERRCIQPVSRAVGECLSWTVIVVAALVLWLAGRDPLAVGWPFWVGLGGVGVIVLAQAVRIGQIIRTVRAYRDETSEPARPVGRIDGGERR